MKRALLGILLALTLVSSLPASVGTHPLLERGDNGTGQDAPGDSADAWPTDNGTMYGNLLPPLDRADWYRFDVLVASQLLFESGSDVHVRTVVITPENDTLDAPFFETDNTTGTYYFGFLAVGPLPAHYYGFVKTAPVNDTHPDPCHVHAGHCAPPEEPQPLPDSGATGTITHEDPIDLYTLDAAAFELVSFRISADHDAGIAVSVQAFGHGHGNETTHAHGDKAPYDDPYHPYPPYQGASAEWFQPYPATLLVTVSLVHYYEKYCDLSTCWEEEWIGSGGDYTLSVSRESDIAMPDLAITGIHEVRRPIKTDFTPDTPNPVNERRTIVIDIANLGEGALRWGGYGFVEIHNERGFLVQTWKGESLFVEGLGPGESTTLKVEWDTMEDIGDYKISVFVGGLPEWFDSDHRNNKAEHETFVKVGGVL